MTGSFSRRSVLKAGAGVLAAPLVARTASAQQRTRLRMAWWGGTDRARRTQEALQSTRGGADLPRNGNGCAIAGRESP